MVTQWGQAAGHTLGDNRPHASAELFDITIQSGVQTRYYRVRAVNEAGVGGSMVGSHRRHCGAAGHRRRTGHAPVLTAVPNEPNGRTEILITWSKPVENGSAITSYTMQVADSGQRIPGQT